MDPSVNVVSKKAKVIVRIPLKNDVKNIFDKEQFQDLMWGSGIEAWKMRVMTVDLNEKLSGQCQRLFEDKQFIADLKSENYEFGIFEPIDFCGYGLLKVIGVDKYAISTPMVLSEEMAYAIGLPGRQVGFPMTQDYHPEMTFVERLINYFTPKLHSLFNEREEVMGLKEIKKYADSNFSKYNVIANARYIFANTDEYMDFPRPISHKIIYIGGITCDVSAADTNTLDADYKDIFDSAVDGVVLISFGSLAKSSEMSSFNKNAFIKTFKKFPKINFIWKYENENDTAANELSNVFKRKWIPQKEILAHPKLVAFITHGGMNSVIEGAHFGIPLLAISLFADQHRNAKMLEYRKTAITLSKSDITESNLIKSLTALTQGKSDL
uniref:glucuronosyltransferase n=1 Tax=Panagrolaimus superbus TaxID=310955 RepID=A0A914YU60_9BILA